MKSAQFRIPSSDPLATILESLTEGVMTVDLDDNITSFNRAAEKMTGVPRHNVFGQRCSDVLRSSICEANCPLRETLETGEPVIARRAYIFNAAGKRIPVSISASPLRNPDGKLIGGVETFRDLSVVEELRKTITVGYSFEDIISKSPSMRKLFDILPAIARSNAVVMIEGESGVGKELLARAIHNLGPNKDKPLVNVNCGALPDSLLESELFGYKAGAFTDARKDKPGRFAVAAGGTIFLDEIGDISMAMQVRLLRVLQEKVYTPLGAVHEEPMTARVIVATHRDLEALVEQEKFRLDLYFRINVMRLTVPPLRDRREDIPLLLDHLIQKYNRLYGKRIATVSADVLTLLMHHDFPGNVRELENLIEHAFILCTGLVINTEHLPLRFIEQVAPDQAAIPQPPESFEDVERKHLISTLEKYKWHRDRTARALGIHKATLFRKIKKLEIELPEQDGRSNPAATVAKP